ncbi:MAG: extracellular solute-binding protein, partial [Anaerolineae bacterium]
MVTHTRLLTRRALLSQAGLFVSALVSACRSQAAPTPLRSITSLSPYPSSTPKPTSTPQPSSEAATPISTASSVAITIDMVDSCFARYAQRQASAFSELYGVDLEFRYASSWDEYLRTVPQSAAAGILDILEIPLGLLVKAWSHYGYLRPLNPLLNLATNPLGDIFPGALEGCTVSGALYGFPYAAGPGECLLGYQPDRFDALGLAYPSDNWTLAELAETAQALNAVDSLGHLALYGYTPEYALPGFITI